MRKLLIGLGVVVVLIAGLIGGLLATGQIGTSTFPILLNTLFGVSGPAADDATVRQRYQVPEGFTLELYAADLPRARFLRFTAAGDLLVSRPGAGDIQLLRRDADGDGHPDARETLVSGLKKPLGLDIHGDWLYIAESNRIGRIRFDSASGTVSGDIQPVVEGLTDDGNHWSKTIRIGPDRKLYLAQGSTCNVCEEEDQRRATMMRFELDGSDPEIIATGLRNSVGFDWAPWNGALYATDNGRDMLGDDFPPCELNLVETGRFYGWPYYNGDNIPDPDMGADPLASERTPTPPAHGFRPHNAPLGMAFLTGDALPPAFRRSAVAALHGSWNRSTPDGYKVVSLHWTAAGIEERDFLSGFNRDGDISGRPVDVAQGPDGAIYVSDDYAGAIYRVAYGDTGASGSDQDMVLPTVSRLDKQPPAWLADADLPRMAESGRALYQRYQCQTCHEQGDNPVSLDGLSQRLGYRAVIDTLEAPQSPMPVFPLSEAERRELAVFLLWQPGHKQ
ncbi:MAG: PQQ-dependent sugar dehydrogenase [Halioglobus sp.]|nr:PQQ-dependent sugar dehydrogenase [Halioglobus sp.]